ncbi:hypothetical protein AAZX31_17G185500 [Glycine max]|uniref:Uncharacterized protein n=1 Tax=Glycine soja TaxID=3848 RepID=A0A445G904_GLYSO|nr:uncharacterized protein LOC114392023 [Glycine soja]RZB57689.1 hypothetical protein D0Y65_046382 [Glycine soja]
MMRFYDLSDTDNDSAIEEIISQAQDAVVLDQVSTINSSAFTDDSLLPSHLETRFRNLKSFPPTKPKPNTIAKARTFSSNLSSANPQSPNFSPPNRTQILGTPLRTRKIVSEKKLKMERGRESLRFSWRQPLLRRGTGRGTTMASKTATRVGLVCFVFNLCCNYICFRVFI